MIRSIAAGLAALALFAPSAQAQGVRDWAAALRQDAQALHDVYADSHAGAVDPLNPGFRGVLDAGLAQALRRADTVHDFGGYLWALREYAARFDDLHSAVGLTDAGRTQAMAELRYAWPGFLTRAGADGPVVAVTTGEADTPPLGARLLGCDGRSADQLAAAAIAPFRGRWRLAAQRAGTAHELFLNQANPFAPQPAACVFEIEGERRTYTLRWRPLSLAEATPLAAEATRPPAPSFELRPYGEDGAWISATSFDSSTSSETAEQLGRLIATVEADREALRAKRTVVLDLRGNSGGSALWARRMAEALWGEAFVAAHGPRGGPVDWRASTANLAHMKTWTLDQRARGLADNAAWGDRIVAGLAPAHALGEPYWRERYTADPAPEAQPATRARVYVITDWTCGSACLDAVDLWKALGAVQVGRETNADSLYMETRRQPLPSGIAYVTVPMKVYRDRPRGLNEPQKPTYAYAADLSDTPALERWIAGLP